MANHNTEGCESEIVIPALEDDWISITDTDDNNYYTDDDYYCYFLSNVITSFLFQLLFAVWLLLFWDNHTYWHINIKSAIKLIQNKKILEKGVVTTS